MTRAETRGRFITFEGADGVGKSTQIAAFTERLASEGADVLTVREPGGTRIGERIRDLLLDAKNAEMTDTTELLLYEAARAQIVAEVIMPALEAGTTVVCDRFYDSTTAYQSFGRGIDRATVDLLNAIGSAGLTPDLTILLDMPTDSSYERATRETADRLEAAGLDFQQRVCDGFRALAFEQPERIVLVDASGTPEDVAARVWAIYASHRGEKDVTR